MRRSSNSSFSSSFVFKEMKDGKVPIGSLLFSSKLPSSISSYGVVSRSSFGCSLLLEVEGNSGCSGTGAPNKGIQILVSI